MNLHDGVRMETRTRFDEVEGYIVEEFPIDAPMAANQIRVPTPPKEPAMPVMVTVADVSLDLARQVVEANGMLCVPASFLNEDQLEELKLNPEDIEQPAKVETKSKAVLTEKQAIKAVQAAASFEELNELTASDSRATVLAAAESRAAELKEQGA